MISSVFPKCHKHHLLFVGLGRKQARDLGQGRVHDLSQGRGQGQGRGHGHGQCRPPNLSIRNLLLQQFLRICLQWVLAKRKLDISFLIDNP